MTDQSLAAVSAGLLRDVKAVQESMSKGMEKREDSCRGLLLTVRRLREMISFVTGRMDEGVATVNDRMKTVLVAVGTLIQVARDQAADSMQIKAPLSNIVVALRELLSEVPKSLQVLTTTRAPASLQRARSAGRVSKEENYSDDDDGDGVGGGGGGGSSSGGSGLQNRPFRPKLSASASATKISHKSSPGPLSAEERDSTGGGGGGPNGNGDQSTTGGSATSPSSSSLATTMTKSHSARSPRSPRTGFSGAQTMLSPRSPRRPLPGNFLGNSGGIGGAGGVGGVNGPTSPRNRVLPAGGPFSLTSSQRGSRPLVSPRRAHTQTTPAPVSADDFGSSPPTAHKTGGSGTRIGSNASAAPRRQAAATVSGGTARATAAGGGQRPLAETMALLSPRGPGAAAARGIGGGGGGGGNHRRSPGLMPGRPTSSSREIERLSMQLMRGLDEIGSTGGGGGGGGGGPGPSGLGSANHSSGSLPQPATFQGMTAEEAVMELRAAERRHAEAAADHEAVLLRTQEALAERDAKLTALQNSLTVAQRMSAVHGSGTGTGTSTGTGGSNKNDELTARLHAAEEKAETANSRVQKLESENGLLKTLCDAEFARKDDEIQRLRDFIAGSAFEGWLDKQGGGKFSAGWRSRFFVLRNGVLLYYAEETDDEPKGFVFLNEATCRKTDNSTLGFEIRTPTRTYYMLAHDKDQLNAWLDKLNEIVAMYQQIAQSLTNTSRTTVASLWRQKQIADAKKELLDHHAAKK